MIDIAGNVLARRSVDRPTRVHLEEIAVVRDLVALLVGEQRPRVLQDVGVLLDWLGREHAEPGPRAADAKRASTVEIRLVYLTCLGDRHSEDAYDCIVH